MEGFMKITKEEIEKLGPCPDGLKWGIENCKGMSNLENILIKLNDHRPDWSRWLFTHLMTEKQYSEIALLSYIATYSAAYTYAERLKLQRKIIRQAVRILERDL
jgi:hypothetical protein